MASWGQYSDTLEAEARKVCHLVLLALSSCTCHPTPAPSPSLSHDPLVLSGLSQDPHSSLSLSCLTHKHVVHLQRPWKYPGLAFTGLSPGKAVPLPLAHLGGSTYPSWPLWCLSNPLRQREVLPVSAPSSVLLCRGLAGRSRFAPDSVRGLHVHLPVCPVCGRMTLATQINCFGLQRTVFSSTIGRFNGVNQSLAQKRVGDGSTVLLVAPGGPGTEQATGQPLMDA